MDSVINKSEGSKATSANSLISGTEPAQDCKLMNASVDIGLLLASSSNSTSGSGDSTYVEDGMEGWFIQEQYFGAKTYSNND